MDMIEVQKVLEKLAEYRVNDRIFQMKQLAKYVERDGIVFIGDSITEGFPLNEFLHGQVIYNRGFSGDTSFDLLSRLDYTVLPLIPKKIFLQIGTNDLDKDITVEVIRENINKACEIIKSEIKDVQIFVLAVYPVCPSEKFLQDDRGAMFLANRNNKKIDNLNNLLERNSVETEYHFLNLNDLFFDENGILNDDYFSDGLHLSIKAYSEIVLRLKEYL